MTIIGRLGLCLALGFVVSSAPASAQDASAQFGDTTVTVGTGIAILGLPDVQFGKIATSSVVTQRFSTSADFAGNIGWNVNGSVTRVIGGGRDVSLSGFWAMITDNDFATCSDVGVPTECAINALVPNPTSLNYIFPLGTMTFQSARDVTQGGAALEMKQWLTPKVIGDTQAPDGHYWALGADWRAIYQDTTISATDSGNASLKPTYAEDLDTNYYGVFAAYGGGFTPPFLAEHWRRWGLQSSFRLQGGLYYADSHYSGSLRADAPYGQALNSDATDSRGDLAFIGGVTLETHKQVTPRSALSFENKLEYYSFVPSMNYNDTITGVLSGPNVGTTIGSAGAFAYRAMLRFTIALGPDGLFAGH